MVARTSKHYYILDTQRGQVTVNSELVIPHRATTSHSTRRLMAMRTPIPLFNFRAQVVITHTVIMDNFGARVYVKPYWQAAK